MIYLSKHYTKVLSKQLKIKKTFREVHNCITKNRIKYFLTILHHAFFNKQTKLELINYIELIAIKCD